MLHRPWVVVLLRIALAVGAAWLLVLMAFSIPGGLADEPLAVRIPAQIVITIVLLAVLAVIVCTWRLLTLVQRDRIFSDASRRWVDALVAALAIGWGVLAVGAAVVVGIVFFGPERDPGLPMLLFGVVVLSALPVLLVVVLRELLRQASGYRAELDEVI